MEGLGRMDVRYSRQTALPEIGKEGQQRLSQASVFVVGAGGLGAPILLYLVAMGVGRIGFVDDDRVGESNLQRQILYTTEEIGQPKVNRAYNRLATLNPDVRLEPYETRLTAENVSEILKDYDIIVDACDNYATRLLVDEVSQRMHKPYVYGAVEGFQGQVSVFNHNESGSYRDYLGCVDRSVDEGRVINVPGALPGVIGSIQAMEVLKLIVGCGEPLSGKLLTIDLLQNDYTIFML